jgi:hypothetical protein
MVDVPDDFCWPQPWKPLPSGWLGRVGSIEAELQSEVCEGHPLYRVACRVVAWNAEDTNEFLFVTDNPAMPLAFVHLTWKAERDPTWPYTVGYPCWDGFRSAWVG